jgi:hypothetical protein
LFGWPACFGDVGTSQIFWSNCCCLWPQDHNTVQTAPKLALKRKLTGRTNQLSVVCPWPTHQARRTTRRSHFTARHPVVIAHAGVTILILLRSLDCLANHWRRATAASCSQQWK